MKSFLLASLLVFSFTVSDKQPEGKSVIEFNAGFNTKNGYKDLGKLDGAKLYRLDIESKEGIREKYNIKSVPTLILFRDGKEMWRWEAGIDMKLHVHYMEVQEAINRY
jgi:hypothetical protein